MWKTVNLSVETRLTKPQNDHQGTPGTQGSAGGLFQKALDVGKRVLAGESLAFQYNRADGGSGPVTFAGVLPGEMRALELAARRAGMPRRTRSWQPSPPWTSTSRSPASRPVARAARVSSSSGSAERHGADRRTRQLHRAQPARNGGKIQVDTGCVVAFQDTVHYGVERVGALNTQTRMTGMFGGEGLSLATLEGDGQVIPSR